MKPERRPAAASERAKWVLLLLAGVMFSVGLAWTFQSLPSRGFNDDLFARWYASGALLHSGRSLYDPANAVEVSDLTGWPRTEELLYYYPAYLHLLTGPLSLLPYPLARFLWTFAGLWFLWIGTAVAARLPKPILSQNQFTAIIVLVTTSVPVIQHTLNAQFNTIGVIALGVTYYCLFRRNFLWAGVCAAGLMFKPQASLVPLAALLLWAILDRRRHLFIAGFALASALLWAAAELFEHNWLLHFVDSLRTYTRTTSVLDTLWNPDQAVAVALVGATLLLTLRLRATEADSAQFAGLLLWTMCVNAVVVPLYGMLHMVSLGLMVIIAVNAASLAHPRFATQFWLAGIALFVAGLLSFIVAIALYGPDGSQIAWSEAVYRTAAPVILGILALDLMRGGVPHAVADVAGRVDYGRISR